jgi:hypothetical protein
MFYFSILLGLIIQTLKRTRRYISTKSQNKTTTKVRIDYDTLHARGDYDDRNQPSNSDELTKRPRRRYENLHPTLSLRSIRRRVL